MSISCAMLDFMFIVACLNLVDLFMLLYLFGIILMLAQALFPTSYSIYLFAQISWLKFVFNCSFKHLKASNHLYPQQMDKNWILNGELGSNAYFRGVLNFMQFVRHHQPDSEVPVYCPCRKCMNSEKRPQIVVEYHVFVHGMDRTTKHGERSDEPLLDPLADANPPEDTLG